MRFVDKHEIKRLYFTNAATEYISVGILVAIVMLLMAKIDGDTTSAIRSIAVFLVLNAAFYLIRLMGNILAGLLLKRHKGTIVNAFESEHGRYAITIEKDGKDRRKKDVSVVYVPAPSYNIYITGMQVEYVNFLNRRLLCIF